MRKIITILLFTIIFSSISFGQVETDYSKTLKKMFEVSGTDESFAAAINQMFVMYEQQYPSIDKEVWTEFKNEFLKTSIDDLVDMLVPVYEKYLTISDIEEMIKFYQTPVGEKYAKSTPLIMTESMQVGQQWGLKIGEKFQEKFKQIEK